jgi:hypothetical protein
MQGSLVVAHSLGFSLVEHLILQKIKPFPRRLEMLATHKHLALKGFDRENLS